MCLRKRDRAKILTHFTISPQSRVTNKTFAFVTRTVPMENNSHISEEIIQREIESLDSPFDEIDWSPANNFAFNLSIPKTVYPPREDTDLLANRIIKLGPGRGRKMLEIGSGSGAVTILAASLGWNVHACDINPFAVSATKGNLEQNGFSGIVKEGGIGPEKFPFEDKFDLVIWNLPYIVSHANEEFLGPMEDAALLDNDLLGLDVRLARCIKSNQLLTSEGIGIMVCRIQSVKSSYCISHRIWDRMLFEDGEEIVTVCLWEPYVSSTSLFLKETGSTNQDILSGDYVERHIYASKQTRGRGRYQRKWESMEKAYAGSWDISENESMPPGIIQLAAALAVVNALDNDQLSVKWPNDIMINRKKIAGVLVESISSSNKSKVVLGIGINIEGSNSEFDFTYSSLSEIGNYDIHDLDRVLHINIANLFELSDNLPPIGINNLISKIEKLVKKYGSPMLNNKEYPNFKISEEGKLILGNHLVDEIDSIDWV